MLSSTTRYTPISGATTISSSSTLNPHNTSFSGSQTTSRSNPINITQPIPLSDRNPSEYSNLDFLKDYFLSFFGFGFGGSYGLYNAKKFFDILKNYRQNNNRQDINIDLEAPRLPIPIEVGLPEYRNERNDLVEDNNSESENRAIIDVSSPRPVSTTRFSNPSASIIASDLVIRGS